MITNILDVNKKEVKIYTDKVNIYFFNIYLFTLNYKIYLGKIKYDIADKKLYFITTPITKWNYSQEVINEVSKIMKEYEDVLVWV